MKSFKAAVTRELRILAFHGEEAVWQPNYHDRVIRNEDGLNRIRDYIAYNPIAWRYDHENPSHQLNETYERAWAWLEQGIRP